MLRGWAALLVFGLTVVVATLVVAFGLTDTLELPARDLIVRLAPSRPAGIAVVETIDEDSIRELGPWPWPRPLLASLVEQAADSGARGVVMDVLLADSRPGDAELARAMRRLPTIVVSVLNERGEWVLPPAPLLEAAIPAHGNFELDRDGIVRRFASTKQSGDRSLPALPLAAAASITSAPIPVGRSVAPAFRTRADAIPQITIASLLRGPRSVPALRGRLVFIGPTALALGDRVLTPTSRRDRADPGVTVHAAAAESLIRGEEIQQLPPLLAGVAAAAGVAFLLAGGRSRGRRVVVAFALGVTTIVAGTILLTVANLAIPVVTFLLAGAVAVAVIETLSVTATLRRSHAAAVTMERGLGLSTADWPVEVEERLEVLAGRLASHREHEAQARQLLAHELKTPLASMRGLTQLLGRFELTEAERRRVASLLEQEAGKLQSLVQALLELEQLPLREFSSGTPIIDLSELARLRSEFLQSSTERVLLVESAPSLHVRGDAALLERVIDNLVTNAIKYTPDHLPVTIRTRRVDGRAFLEVEDRGPGIRPADRQRIFERFVRGSTAAGTQGLGLGLSFVAEIARWHRGSILVEGPSEGGALFRLELPLTAEKVEEGN
ncbi:MAG: CHASE2 domain-containing protein [Acidobacteriota bacterium]